jgi:FtsZ-binding cell division protein ZapB
MQVHNILKDWHKYCVTLNIHNKTSKFIFLFFGKIAKLYVHKFIYVCYFFRWEIEDLQESISSLENENQDLKDKYNLSQSENKDSNTLKLENESSKIHNFVSSCKIL